MRIGEFYAQDVRRLCHTDSSTSISEFLLQTVKRRRMEICSMKLHPGIDDSEENLVLRDAGKFPTCSLLSWSRSCMYAIYMLCVYYPRTDSPLYSFFTAIALAFVCSSISSRHHHLARSFSDFSVDVPCEKFKFSN